MVGRTTGKIYVDGANPPFIKALKLQMGEDEDYDEIIKECKAKQRDYEFEMDVIPVNFSTTEYAWECQDVNGKRLWLCCY
jgi:hypothetical protein